MKIFSPKPLIYIEYLYIYKTLEHFSFNRSYSAKSLDISKRTLRNKIHRMRLAGINISTKPMHSFRIDRDMSLKDNLLTEPKEIEALNCLRQRISTNGSIQK